MATASPSKSDFSVVLFNCDARMVPFTNPRTGKRSTRRIVNDVTRKECVSQVLPRLEPGDDNLFLLVQDEISGPIHRIISQSVAEHTQKHGGPNIKNAEVFSFSKQHDIKYIHRLKLKNIYDDMDIRDNNPFQICRLSVCVVTHRTTKAKMLLVSWHGPNKIPDEAKRTCFNTAINFLKNLQDETQCSSVLCGGDFNIPAENVKKMLAKWHHQLEGKIYKKYPVPDYLDASSIKDYIIYWPASHFGQFDVKASVIDPHYKDNVEPIEYPFGHPIIKFTFKEREPQSAAPGLNLETGHENQSEQRGQTELSDDRINALEREQDDQNSDMRELTRMFRELELRIDTLEMQEKQHKKEVREKDKRIAMLENQLRKLKAQRST